MYEELQGKKLLILGASYSEISLVERAQQFGVYVIVTDYHTDYKLSPAKKYADEAWDISWSELDTLEKKCQEARVDGITAGYSEIRVENLIKLCKKLNLPCYCTMEQLDITRDKIKFKEECRKHGVPTVKEFASIEEVDTYPVIVKPVDRAGSIGISIATNQEELKVAYTYAMEKSLCKKVIIEEYIHKAVKFDAYYEIIDDEIKLISSDDVINAKNNGFDKVVQSGWVLPSIHQNIFKEKIDSNMKKMIRNMGIHNGYIFFSGFADKNSNFVFFECGFRLCGGYLFNYFSELGEYSNLDIFILHALTGTSKQVVKTKKKNSTLKCVTLNVYSKAGKISEINGWDKVERLKDCLFALQYAYQGQECNDDKAILSKVGMAYCCNSSIEKLAEDVEKMNQLFEVKGQHGEDLIYDRIEPEYIVSWYNGSILKSL